MDGLDRLAPWPAPGTGTHRWFVPWRPCPDARLRLFCAPHTGAGAAAYRLWAEHMTQVAPGIEVVAIRLPARETRFREPPVSRLHDLLAALRDGIEPWLDRPCAWFGHSMGALIAFETCRMLRREGLAEPVRLLVSGRAAPHLPPRMSPVYDKPPADIITRLRELNGTPREVLEDRPMLTALLPMLRGDFAVAETYRFQPGEPLPCPISAFGGLDDPLATSNDLQAWDRHSAAGCTVRMYGGGHFFLHEHYQRLLPAIAEDLGCAEPAARP